MALEFIKQTTDKIAEKASGIADNVAEKASGIAGNVAEKASGIAGSVAEKASGIAGNVAEKASGLAGNVEKKASGLTDNVTEKASGLADNVAEKASSVAGNVEEKASSLASSLADNVFEFAVSTALNTFGKRFANNYLEGIVEFEKITIKNGAPVAHFKLVGVPDKDFMAKIGKVEIAEDGSSITVGDYRSYTPFVENALNRYASVTIPVTDAMHASVLSKARRIFGENKA